MIDLTMADRGGLLCLRTSPTTLSSFLGGFGTLAVPPFQRTYAWEDEHVSAFLSDVERCRYARQTGESVPHFFGAIVSCMSAVPGTSRPHNILIDGQQRLATLFMLIVHLRQRFERAAELAQAAHDDELHKVFAARAASLQNQFETARDVEFSDPKTVRKLRLSDADDAFFGALIAGEECAPNRVSHQRLGNAFQLISSHFDGLLERAADPSGYQMVLDPLYQAFIKDWSVVHLSADDRRHANLIFRVLNKRGVRITEGELLRARTLEAAAPQLEALDLSAMSAAWDEILTGEPLDADEALRIVFQSRFGRRPSEGGIDSEYETEFFPAVLETQNLTQAESGGLYRSVLTLCEEIRALSRLGRGYPPLEEANAIDAVSRSRLHALITILKQSYCLPLLLAGQALGPQEFAKLADVVERFAFRYAVIVRAQIYPVSSVFHDHAVRLREDPGAFRLGDLIVDLQGLLNDFADDNLFAQQLRSLKYGQDANPAIRYLLIMLEHMMPWWADNPQGRPVCRDLTRVLDFATITIEHIQPRNAPAPDPDLTPYIDTLGNLTLLSANENDALGNKPFAEKKPVLAASTLRLNTNIAEYDEWAVNSLEERTSQLVEMSLAVFTLAP